MGGRGAKRSSARSEAPKGVEIDVRSRFSKTKTSLPPEEALVIAMDSIRNLDYEVSVLIAPDGTIYTTVGDDSSVAPAWEQARADGYDVSTLIDLHNHPDGTPPSPADWDTMLYWGQSASYVASSRGDYVIRITDQSKLGKAIAFFSEAGGKMSNYERNADKAYLDGCFDRYSKPGSYGKAMYDTLKKFGPRYGFDIEFIPKPGWEDYYD